MFNLHIVTKKLWSLTTQKKTKLFLSYLPCIKLEKLTKNPANRK